MFSRHALIANTWPSTVLHADAPHETMTHASARANARCLASLHTALFFKLHAKGANRAQSLVAVQLHSSAPLLGRSLHASLIHSTFQSPLRATEPRHAGTLRTIPAWYTCSSHICGLPHGPTQHTPAHHTPAHHTLGEACIFGSSQVRGSSMMYDTLRWTCAHQHLTAKQTQRGERLLARGSLPQHTRETHTNTHTLPHTTRQPCQCSQRVAGRPQTAQPSPQRQVFMQP